MPEIEARACRTLFPQPIGQLDAALAAHIAFPAIYSILSVCSIVMF